MTFGAYLLLRKCFRCQDTELTKEDSKKMAVINQGKQSDWKKEQGKTIDFPWGWPEMKHKESLSPLVYDKQMHAHKHKHNPRSEYSFSYNRMIAAKRTLKSNATDEKTGFPYHTQLYTSRPYMSSKKVTPTSTCMERVTAAELEKINFGIKQKGPMYYTNKEGEACYTLEDHVEGKEIFQQATETHTEIQTRKQNSIHEASLNPTVYTSKSIISSPRGSNYNSIKVKGGLGPKFYNRGSNGCINAIVTRYDRYGNVQMMAMIRPESADSDPGDYQMSAGCIFFGEELTFNNVTIPKFTSTPYCITSGEENVDAQTGQIRGRGLAYARAAIYSKLWHGEEFKDLIDTWNFDKVGEGIVDDVSNTSQAWVETSYNVHHVTGMESQEELSKLVNAKVNKERKNVGFGVWRSIDTNPRDEDNVSSQFYVEKEKEDGSEGFENVLAKHDKGAAKFDPFVEFDLWHGEHSFVARTICDYVKSRYAFQEPALDDENGDGDNGNSPFGKCTRIS